MGHREQLLAGAKRCLVERGYANTTARDIVAASDTNLASIGYHFGSKEALLNAAIVDAFEDFGQRLQELLRDDGAATSPLDRLQAAWGRMIESFTAERPLWIASVEAFLRAEHVPELREQFADGYEDARAAFPGMMLDSAGERIAPGSERAVGSVALALMVGLMLHWLLDPHRAPSAAELADGLRALAAVVGGEDA